MNLARVSKLEVVLGLRNAINGKAPSLKPEAREINAVCCSIRRTSSDVDLQPSSTLFITHSISDHFNAFDLRSLKGGGERLFPAAANSGQCLIGSRLPYLTLASIP